VKQLLVEFLDSVEIIGYRRLRLRFRRLRPRGCYCG